MSGRRTASALLAVVAAGLTSLAPVPVQAASTPLLVGLRASHHPGVDRVVFEFSGGLPASRSASYVPTLLADGSGLPVRIAGRAVLQVRFATAAAHTSTGRLTLPFRSSFSLPNLMTAVRSGDNEGVTTYGLGLLSRQPFRVYALRSPSRVVVDVSTAPVVSRRVWFFDQRRFVANAPPFFRPVWRSVLPGLPATSLMHRLYAGPTLAEQSTGLRLLLSGSTGFTGLSVADGIARVRLLGGCRSGGSTVTVAGSIMPTLRQLPQVDVVKVYDPAGRTLTPTGRVDSVPECLEP